MAHRGIRAHLLKEAMRPLTLSFPVVTEQESRLPSFRNLTTPLRRAITSRKRADSQGSMKINSVEGRDVSLAVQRRTVPMMSDATGGRYFRLHAAQAGDEPWQNRPANRPYRTRTALGPSRFSCEPLGIRTRTGRFIPASPTRPESGAARVPAGFALPGAR